MLKIQRASAGSGKTYALAQNYILNLIAYKNAKGEWKLRNSRQIEDALTHILAITFTNKATNEMKQRIVKNLSLISRLVDFPNPPFSILENTPYILYFQQVTGASVNEIASTARKALRVLLNNYYRFKISTIDSFFQEILRTFTFEANINDSYQLEIDSEAVSAEALDIAMHELDHNTSSMGKASFWFKVLMRSKALESQSWNPFNKKSSTGSIFRELKNSLKELEDEKFKDIKEHVDLFYSDPRNLDGLIDFYKSLYSQTSALFAKIKQKAKDIKDIIKRYGIPSDDFVRYFPSHIDKILKLKISDNKVSFSFKSFLDKKTFLKKDLGTVGNSIDTLAEEMYGLLKEWNEPEPDSFLTAWRIFGPLLPYFGLILEVRKYLTEVLETNNLLQLSDTNHILKRIIGEDDTPFVYERLGARIDNYLIDEFQDTSRMQWDVIYPLLNESEGKGEDSLIIGDPKQSIYRFRNADHTLITKVVPETFKNHEAAGFSKEDNTNWRSNTLIVKFNNTFFKQLASQLSDFSIKNGTGYDYSELYGNVVQYPNNQKGKGYVEIRRFEKPLQSDFENEDDSDEEGSSGNKWFERQALKNIGPLVSSLIKRGYKQKDIGILVTRNSQGKDVVEALIDYNGKIGEGEPKIDFISEESLLISSSSAVTQVINIIEKIAKPGDRIKIERRAGEPEKDNISSYKDWNDLKINFSLFAMKHPEMEPSVRIMSFLENPESENSIEHLIKSMSFPSLPSLVERIIKTFLDGKLRKTDAIYLASLQDIINEYCQNHQEDPASFLEWWYEKGIKATVASPESTDAVQIMTIHKSKGLEFNCVIIPFAKDSFNPSNSQMEWRWVKPPQNELLDFPPVLPVKTSSALKGSQYEGLYKEFLDQFLTDKLNSFYVAFTRAKNELYIFTTRTDKETNSLNSYLYRVLKDYVNDYENCGTIDSSDLLKPEDIAISELEEIITVGTPFSKEEILEENKKEEKKSTVVSKFIEDYYVNPRPPKLRAVASMVTPSGE